MPQRATWLMRGGSLRYAPVPVLPLLLLLMPVLVHTVCNNDCSSAGTNLKYAQLVRQHYTVTTTGIECGNEESSGLLGTKTVAECAKACRLLDKPHFTSFGDGNCKCSTTCNEDPCTGCVGGVAFRGCAEDSGWLGAPKTQAQCADLCEAHSPAKNFFKSVDFGGGDQNCMCFDSCPNNEENAQMTTYKIIRGCSDASAGATGWQGWGNSAKWCAATCHALGKTYFHRVTGGDNNCKCFNSCDDRQDAAYTAYEIVTTSTPGTVGTQLGIYDSDRAAMMAALVLCTTFATWEQIAKIVHRRPPFLQRTTRSTFASSGAAYQTSSHGTESAFLRWLRACQLACQLACVLACIKRPP